MISYFVRHPTVANLLMVLIVLPGLFSLPRLNRTIFPVFVSDFIHVETVCKGATAQDIEEHICVPIEDALEPVDGIERVTSIARENHGLVRIEVRSGASVSKVIDDVRAAVDRIDNLPDEAEEPKEAEAKRIDHVIMVAVAAPDEMPEMDLYALAEGLRHEMLRSDGVSRAVLKGFSEHIIRIEVHEEALRAFGLTISELAARIKLLNLDLPAGSVESSEREIEVRVMEQRHWAEEFRNLPVITDAAGAQIPLRTLAEVSDTFKDDAVAVRFNGKRSANIQVEKAEDEDTIEVARAVHAFIEARKGALPQGVTLEAWGDWSNLIEDRLDMLYSNAIQGFVLVFLTLWLFLDIRLSFWVAFGIPVSFLGTLFVMGMSGATVNSPSPLACVEEA